jgi:hypothetical protein
MMERKNGYWRDARPSDAAHDPPKFLARFSITASSWCHEDWLYGVSIDENCKGYRLLWDSKKSSWQYCQVFIEVPSLEVK